MYERFTRNYRSSERVGDKKENKKIIGFFDKYGLAATKEAFEEYNQVQYNFELKRANKYVI